MNEKLERFKAMVEYFTFEMRKVKCEPNEILMSKKAFRELRKADKHFFECQKRLFKRRKYFYKGLEIKITNDIEPSTFVVCNDVCFNITNFAGRVY